MNKLQTKLAAAAALAVAAVSSAHAALPTEATAAFATISGNVTDVLAAMWPIVALATGGFVLVKLFKKGANKAV
ncbi:major coat protein [Dechloromonas hortensis]|uniref:major coat protein n=1 Tax=Dechloromonas hortensis TaxID=337779 RepID=UPI0012918F92|nr:major coat protein [Dechloromonas hortensis]